MGPRVRKGDGIGVRTQFRHPCVRPVLNLIEGDDLSWPSCFGGALACARATESEYVPNFVILAYARIHLGSLLQVSHRLTGMGVPSGRRQIPRGLPRRA